MPFFQNTYRKLDRDTAVNKYDNKSYYDARNIRVVSLDDLKSGAITNMKGNVLTQSFLPGYADDYIIGHGKMRGYTILITTPSTSMAPNNTYGRIWKVNLSKENIVPIDFVCVYSGILNLSAYYPIENVVTFYENENIQKIYWSDNYNYFRYCNIADPLLNTYSAAQFEIVQDISFSQPVLTEISIGTIPVGMVQYAYRLYNVKGSASNFSPAGNLIPITSSSEAQADSSDYRGSDALDSDGNPVNSGKGVIITISNVDTNYNRIEVVAIHYSSLNAAPTINIVSVLPVSSTVIVYDNGNYNSGTYSLEEFVLVNNPFVCKTIDTKNNILFAGNIQQNEFDVEYDTRAFRWTAAGDCYLWQKGKGAIYHNNSIGANAHIWGYYSVIFNTWTRISEIHGMSNLPLNIDAIHGSTDIGTDKLQTVDKYQSDRVTLGGEGVNVKYKFTRKADTFINTFDVASGALGNSSMMKPYYFTGMDSPYYNQEHTSWAHDEIYRMSAVLTDTKGRVSPPKWIGDIRMPNQHYNFGTANSGYIKSTVFVFTNLISALPFEVEFEFDNLPSNIKYVQIVYVKRDNANKTVVTQGRAGWMVRGVSGFGTDRCIVNPADSIFSTLTSYGGGTVERQHLYMVSPEISFYKNISQGQEDYIEIIGGCTKSILYSTDAPRQQLINCWGFTPSSSTENNWYRINDVLLKEAEITPDQERTSLTFAGITVSPLVMDYNKNTGSGVRRSDHGTMLFVNVNRSLAAPSGMNTTYVPIVNYRRNLYGTQYGGNSYLDRQKNEYIAAGPIAVVNAGSATAKASWGDVWINYHDQLTGFYNQAYGDYSYVEYLPLESTVNLTYRHDDCYHRIRTHPQRMYLKEKNNAEFTIGSTTYTPGWSDLYLINTVYSRKADAKKYYAAPLDYDPQTISDTLVIASDMKLGNEDIDPWTSWATNESINVDNAYGPINRIVGWRDHLLYFQDDAVGILAVLERSLVQDSQNRNVSLGQGEILQRYDNIATGIGISTKFSLSKTANGIYWYDHKRKRIHRFRNSIEDLTTVKGVNSYLNAIPDDYADYDNAIVGDGSSNQKGFIMTYNALYNEIWFTVKNSMSDGTVLIYNEILDSFVSFADTRAYYQIAFDQKLFSITTGTPSSPGGPYYKAMVYQENVGYYGHFFGQYKTSYVTLVINPMPNITVTFSNYEITTEVYSGATEIQDKSITTIRTTNSYQDTGEIVLNANTTRRRLRTWRMASGRNFTDKARLRDTYAKATLTFQNTIANQNIVLHDLITLYMTPAEAMVNKANQR